MDTDSIKPWHFGTENDKLIELVLNGNKKATISLLKIIKWRSFT